MQVQRLRKNLSHSQRPFAGRVNQKPIKWDLTIDREPALDGPLKEIFGGKLNSGVEPILAGVFGSPSHQSCAPLDAHHAG